MRQSQIKIIGNILAVMNDIKTGQWQLVHGKNLVTYTGDMYYTIIAARGVPTYDLGVDCYMQLGFDTTSPTKSDTKCGTVISGSAKLLTTLYPCRDDQDPLNTGAGIYTVSYKFEWGASEVVEADIAECIIGNSTAETPDALLMRGLFSPAFEKTESQILRVFVNHTILGS